MTSIFGNSILYIVLLINALSFFSLFGLIKGKTSIVKYVKFYTDLTFIFLSFAFILLIYAFVVTDYSLSIVIHNSHEAKPLLYKISGAWANHEGSMLLWIWLFSVLNVLFLHFNNFSKIDAAKILSIQSAILFCFLSFILFNSNAFAPAQEYFPVGKGLNPLLQDFGLLIHPPTLYLGLVNFSLGFSIAIIALLNGDVDKKWFDSFKPWIIIPWLCLTAGIGLGSWWAYRELGWGGFWFWDPVENASLLPWLSATALLHSIKLSSVRGYLKSWSLLLAITTFILTIFATFLVRSGIVTSVHSFALDTAKGTFIFSILSLSIVTGITIFFKKAHRLYSNEITNYFSKDAGIIANNILLLFVAVAILIGILYPISYEFFYNKIVVISEVYYLVILKLSIIPFLILISIFLFLKWEKDEVKYQIVSWIIIIILAILCTFATYLYKPIDSYFILLILAFSYFAGISLIVHFIKSLILGSSYFHNVVPMFLSHFGFVAVVISIALNSTWEQEARIMIKTKEVIEFANYHIKFQDINYKKRDNFLSRQANLLVYNSNNIELAILNPEIRFYPVENIFTTESSIYHSFFNDLYVTIGEILPGSKVIVRLQYKPLINTIWLGVGLMIFGGCVALIKKRIKL
jgi:cytochrome c-type biogenesis protein CcmF